MVGSAALPALGDLAGGFVGRIAAEGFLKLLERLAQAAGATEHDADFVVQISIARLQPHHRLQLAQRLRRATQRLEQGGVADAGFDILRPRREDCLEIGGGFRQAATLGLQAREIVASGPRGGLPLQRGL